MRGDLTTPGRASQELTRQGRQASGTCVMSSRVTVRVHSVIHMVQGPSERCHVTCTHTSSGYDHGDREMVRIIVHFKF